MSKRRSNTNRTPPAETPPAETPPADDTAADDTAADSAADQPADEGAEDARSSQPSDDAIDPLASEFQEGDDEMTEVTLLVGLSGAVKSYGRNDSFPCSVGEARRLRAAGFAA